LCVNCINGYCVTEEDAAMKNRFVFFSDLHQIREIDVPNLDFDCERRMSSRVVVDDDGVYWIYSKGAFGTFYDRARDDCKAELREIYDIMIKEYPELRLLVCGYRQLVDANNVEENNLIPLGIIGMRDCLQDKVLDTVDKFSDLGIKMSMCTGDNKTTAMYIAKEIGIVNDSTLIFGGPELNHVIDIISKYDNFIGYELKPLQKGLIVKKLEEDAIKVLAIGDGYNDLEMFDASSISVSIQGHNYVETKSDFSITDFSKLSRLLDCSINCYNKNSKLINITFFRCSSVVLATVTYCLINHHAPYLFSGFVLQAFNFCWIIFGLGYYALKNDYHMKYSKNDYLKAKLMSELNNENTTYFNIMGFTTGVLLVVVANRYVQNTVNDLVAMILISIINFKMFRLYGFDLCGLLFCLVGIVNYLLYSVLIGSFLFRMLFLLSRRFWIPIIGLMIVNLLFV